MGQIQTNWFVFFKDLTDDSTEKNLLIRRNQMQQWLEQLKQIKKEGKSNKKYREIDVKKLNTHHAICENESEDDIAETNQSHPSEDEECCNNLIKIVDNNTSSLQNEGLLQELGVPQLKNYNFWNPFLSNVFCINKVALSQPTKDKMIRKEIDAKVKNSFRSSSGENQELTIPFQNSNVRLQNKLKRIQKCNLDMIDIKVSMDHIKVKSS